jgi:hypothetical protein
MSLLKAGSSVFIHFPFRKRVAAGLSDPAQSSFSGNGDVPGKSPLFIH